MEMVFVGVVSVLALGFTVWAGAWWLLRHLTGDERDEWEPRGR